MNPLALTACCYFGTGRVLPPAPVAVGTATSPPVLLCCCGSDVSSVQSWRGRVASTSMPLFGREASIQHRHLSVPVPAPVPCGERERVERNNLTAVPPLILPPLLHLCVVRCANQLLRAASGVRGRREDLVEQCCGDDLSIRTRYCVIPWFWELLCLLKGSYREMLSSDGDLRQVPDKVVGCCGLLCLWASAASHGNRNGSSPAPAPAACPACCASPEHLKRTSVPPPPPSISQPLSPPSSRHYPARAIDFPFANTQFHLTETSANFR